MATPLTSQNNEGSNEEQGYQEETNKRYNNIIQTLPKEKGWWFQNLFQCQGFWLPPHAVKSLLLLEDHFICNPTDVILATSPKCGTTWLRALVFATLNRNHYEFATHPLITANPRDLVPFLESYLYRNEPTSLPSPRLFSTHLPYTLFPDSVKGSGCRFIYVCRNPKDVFVSKWHFMNKIRSRELSTSLCLQDAFEMFQRGVSHYGPFWDHVLSYWNAYLQAPNQVLFLIYEELQRDPLVQVKKLAEFLGTPFSMEEENAGIVQEIIKLCSFENLSNLLINKDTNSDIIIKNPDFFRKGTVGDWKNLLTLEMAGSLDQATKEKLQGSGLSFLESV
ncbi:hypothetical protein K2173_002467 [Erythroxylum novogranatense]|uniref:Sulfotransferase n=1 Tax=Erythroxylum novogranatense TaxID=1862640 RepID=A0AAV8TBB8_9ROSI|nr:hypothetical protein K2173_002467 [Erythroxylum novogranatense]